MRDETDLLKKEEKKIGEGSGKLQTFQDNVAILKFRYKSGLFVLKLTPAN